MAKTTAKAQAVKDKSEQKALDEKKAALDEIAAKAREIKLQFADMFTGGAATGINDILKGVDQIGDAFTKFKSSFSGIGKSSSTDFIAEMAQATTPLIGGIKAVTSAVTSFTSNMSGAIDSVRDLSKQQEEGTDDIYDYTKTIKDMASTIPVLGDIVGMFTGIVDMTANLFGIKTAEQKEAERIAALKKQNDLLRQQLDYEKKLLELQEQ